jgi:nucleotide-binding universal stress UspA family protein
MRKLLVPFDGSENALRALRHAISLARQSSPTSIHVVIAYEEPDFQGEVEAFIPRAKFVEVQRRRCESRLEAAARLLDDAGVPYTKEVLSGPAGQVIAKRADELGCDAIVMGTRGMSAVGNLMMGSIATRVVHFANMPVTLVK